MWSICWILIIHLDLSKFVDIFMLCIRDFQYVSRDNGWPAENISLARHVFSNIKKQKFFETSKKTFEALAVIEQILSLRCDKRVFYDGGSFVAFFVVVSLLSPIQERGVLRRGLPNMLITHITFFCWWPQSLWKRKLFEIIHDFSLLDLKNIIQTQAAFS